MLCGNYRLQTISTYFTHHIPGGLTLVTFSFGTFSAGQRHSSAPSKSSTGVGLNDVRRLTWWMLYLAIGAGY